MTRGSSKTSASSEPRGGTHVAWLAALILYGLAAGADLAHHLLEDLHTGNQRIAYSEFAVAFSAGLFWPIDIVAMALLAAR